MKKYLINYAHLSHTVSQARLTQSGLQYGFDGTFSMSYINLSKEFISRYEHILKQRRGAGYWIWKPYIMFDTLLLLNDGDWLFYADSGSLFIHSVQPIIELGQNITLFHLDQAPSNVQAVQTKRDAFVLMGLDKPEYANAPNVIHAGFQMYRKCSESLEFLSEYLTYCKDERIVTDMDNTMGLPNYPQFKDHRHDQSVLSLLVAKYNLPSFRDLTQYGNPFIKPGEYPQIINHTRNTN